MTSLLATRRRAEDFARLVEGSRRSHDPNVAPLLELVAMLRPVAIQPSEAFRASLRERLLAVAAERPRDPSPEVAPVPAVRSAVRTPARVRVVAIACAVVLAGGTASTAAAARGALPGDLLYPLKRGLEQSQAAATTNPESRGSTYLDQATTRLGEVSQLSGGTPVAAGDLDKIALSQATLGAFSRDVRDAGNLLFEAYQRDDRTAPLIQLRQFVATTRPQLLALEKLLPAQVGDAYAEALATLDRLDRRVLDVCPQCLIGSVGDGDGIITSRQEGPASRSAGPDKTGATGRSGRAADPPWPEPRTGSRVSTDTLLSGPLLPLPLPWRAGSGSDATLGDTVSALGLPASHSLAVPLPRPRSLSLPLPLELQPPASGPADKRAPAPRPTKLIALPWLLPYGGDEPDQQAAPAPPGLLPGLLPSPASSSEHPPSPVDRSPAPTPANSPGGKASPSPSPSPSPGAKTTPSPSPSSDGGLIENLLGPLYLF
jgi:Domain of unknown function (DUF5667)